MLLQNFIRLLTARRFLPVFVTQALEAFNDNAIRSTFIIIITYQATSSAAHAALMANLSAILFNLPFIFLSHIAGQISEKFNKQRLIRYIKLIEVICMALAGAAILYDNTTLLLACVFIMGLHSTLFGPIKYAILPDLMPPRELVSANALVESSTFVMILLGYAFGTYLIGLHSGKAISAFLMFSMALVGWGSSFLIPKTTPYAQQPSLKLDWRFIRHTKGMLQHLKQDPKLFTSLLLIAWFWYYGITLQVQFSSYAKYALHTGSDAVLILIATMALGISCGGFLCSRLLKHKNSLRYTPLGVFATSLFTLLLVASTPHAVAAGTPLYDLHAFFGRAHHWVILIELFLLSGAAGLYVLPLYVSMQQSPISHRSRTVASCNILAAIAMFLAGGVAILLTLLGCSATQIFFISAILNLIVAIRVFSMLPQATLHSVFKWLIKLIYKVRVTGLEHLEQAGERQMIIANHSSFLDVPLLACFLPKELTFAINAQIAVKWWIKPFLSFAETYVIESDNAMALKSIIKEISNHKTIVVFPEGRITTTGGLMKVYEGPAMIADKAQARVIPIRIDGVQFTRFARSKNFFSRLVPQLKISICEPELLTAPESCAGRARREFLSLKLYDIMTNMLFASGEKNITLFDALLRMRSLCGGSRVILEDANYKQLSYNSLVTKSYVIARSIANTTQPQQTLGIMLATSLAASVLFFAMQSCNRIPAMLNFNAGFEAMLNACHTAEIKVIYTARKFIDAAKLQPLIDKLSANSIQIIFMEDLVEKLKLTDKLHALLYSKLNFIYRNAYGKKTDPHSPAVILFTSGSEGTPKGVVLSHYNIHSNCQQVAARVDVNMRDIIFNTLPMFHCFGLTMGTLLPILNGSKAILYPSPLHYRIVPEMIYERNATILFSTNTFLNGYARSAHAYDLHSIRYIFAGAEALRESTRQLYHKKFGIRIFEGYGVTETTPVAAVNTAMHNKTGSVGRILPGMKTRLQPVEGIADGGQLLLQGPNVMLGYLKHDKPGVLQATGQWYNTGDIVTIDAQGFITIQGRAKRFAKLAGEMVSLSAVEDIILELWPEHLHAVLSVRDERKGERLLLITEYMQAEITQLLQFAKQNNYPELMLPKQIIHVTQLPVLGSGKVDYVTLKKQYQHLAP